MWGNKRNDMWKERCWVTKEMTCGRKGEGMWRNKIRGVEGKV